MTPTNLKVGDKVRWRSYAGRIYVVTRFRYGCVWAKCIGPGSLTMETSFSADELFLIPAIDLLADLVEASE